MEIIDLILIFEFNPIFGSILILRGLSRDLGVSHTFILRTRGDNIYSEGRRKRRESLLPPLGVSQRRLLVVDSPVARVCRRIVHRRGGRGVS